jgi:D-hydroxyproline dehydrogenase subunit gamma
MKPRNLTLKINGQPCEAMAGMTVAAAMAQHHIRWGRRSVTGEPRAGLCGMGVCFECRVTINGVSHQRACQTVALHNMDVVTDV